MSAVVFHIRVGKPETDNSLIAGTILTVGALLETNFHLTGTQSVIGCVTNAPSTFAFMNLRASFETLAPLVLMADG